MGRALCQMHYGRLKRGAEIGGPELLRGGRPVNSICSIDGCGRKHNSGGLCLAHQRRLLKGHDLTTPIAQPSLIEGDNKCCTECERWFPLTHFEPYRKMCRECRSLHRRATNHGVSFEDMRAMIAVGCCDVCEIPLTYTEAQVDHDHDSGRVRGVLCTMCNLAIGYMDDDPARAEALAAYLRKFS